jgi:hypothetical protein
LDWLTDMSSEDKSALAAYLAKLLFDPADEDAKPAAED